MRHIDDLRFEIEALKDHATRSNNETLMASACFMADTLNSLERFLTESERKAPGKDKIVTPQVTALDGVTPLGITPGAFPVGRSDND